MTNLIDTFNVSPFNRQVFQDISLGLLPLGSWQVVQGAGGVISGPDAFSVIYQESGAPTDPMIIRTDVREMFYWMVIWGKLNLGPVGGSSNDFTFRYVNVDDDITLGDWFFEETVVASDPTAPDDFTFSRSGPDEVPSIKAYSAPNLQMAVELESATTLDADQVVTFDCFMSEFPNLGDIFGQLTP